MVSFNEYLKDVLNQIHHSYQILNDLTDKPGDLEIIKKELSKINGLLHVLLNKLESKDTSSDAYVELLSSANNYFENYEFTREIHTMSKLYSEDPHRLKNLRSIVLKSLRDKKLIERIESLLKNL